MDQTSFRNETELALKPTPPTRKNQHDRCAPYWAAAIVILGMMGLSSDLLFNHPFWSGYALDITGPAWNYILFRGLFTYKKDNRWTRFFKPVTTYVIFVLVCFGIEGMQYLEWYDSTFDPLDLLAYLSVLTPLFLIDLHLNQAPRKN